MSSTWNAPKFSGSSDTETAVSPLMTPIIRGGVCTVVAMSAARLAPISVPSVRWSTRSSVLPA